MRIQVGENGTTYEITENTQFQFLPKDDPFTVVTILVAINGKSYIQKDNQDRIDFEPGIHYKVAGIFFLLLDDQFPGPIGQ